MRTRKTLDGRIHAWMTGDRFLMEHEVVEKIRAELDRLARQIRKMDVVRQDDVLRLIKSAKR